MLEWEKKPGRAGQNGGEEEKRSPDVESFSGDESVDYDESGRDPYQAYYHVQESER